MKTIQTFFLYLSICLSVLSYVMGRGFLKVIGIIGIIITFIILEIVVNEYFKSGFYKGLNKSNAPKEDKDGN